MLIGIIAMTKEGVIGKKNALPWSYPEELKLFRSLTINHKLIMGRKTFVSLPHPLPHRYHIVLSQIDPINKISETNRDVMWTNNYLDLVNQYENTSEEVFVIGGAEIFKLFAPYITKWYVSLIHYPHEGDILVPLTIFESFIVINKIAYPDFDFITYQRKT